MLSPPFEFAIIINFSTIVCNGLKRNTIFYLNKVKQKKHIGKLTVPLRPIKKVT
jgi:hypothetical protein